MPHEGNDDAMLPDGGLDWGALDVRQFIDDLPPNMRLHPVTSLPDGARANLRQAFLDAKQHDAAAAIDQPVTAAQSLEDMRLIVRELAFLQKTSTIQK